MLDINIRLQGLQSRASHDIQDWNSWEICELNQFGEVYFLPDMPGPGTVMQKTTYLRRSSPKGHKDLSTKATS